MFHPIKCTIDSMFHMLLDITDVNNTMIPRDSQRWDPRFPKIPEDPQTPRDPPEIPQTSRVHSSQRGGPKKKMTPPSLQSSKIHQNPLFGASGVREPRNLRLEPHSGFNIFIWRFPKLQTLYLKVFGASNLQFNKSSFNIFFMSLFYNSWIW